MKVPERPIKASEGSGKATSRTPQFADIAFEYHKLNTREARVAFVDTFLKTWAYNFEQSWPVIYQALEWVEEEKLYADPRVIDPKESYADFKSYFEARLKQPFSLWFALEATHQYIAKYAPELLEASWTKARQIMELTAKIESLPDTPRGGDRKSAQYKESKNQLVNNNLILSETGSTNRKYLIARLKRDTPQIAQRLADGQFTSVRAAAIEAGIVKVPTPLKLLQKAWAKASETERAAFRATICNHDDPRPQAPEED